METNSIISCAEDFPTSLSAEEWTNPLLVLDQFFHQYTLDRAQLLLAQGLPLTFTDETGLSPDQRYEILHMLHHLEKLVNASWVLVHHYETVLEYTPKTHLKDWIKSNTISFLSLTECLKPVATIRTLFDTSPHNNWKPSLLKDIQEAMFNPLFHILENSECLREFTEYVKLNKILEATFLLVRNEEPSMIPSLNWRLQMCQTDPLNWGTYFYTEAGIEDALESFAFITDSGGMHRKWNATAGCYLIQCYEKIYKLLHLAHWLACQAHEQKHNGHLTSIQNSLSKKFNRTPVWELSRFLTSSVMNAGRHTSPTFRHPDINTQIRSLNEIMHLSADYFTSHST